MENNSELKQINEKGGIWCMPEQHYKSREKENSSAKNGYLHDNRKIISMSHYTQKVT